jgi:hypothetical protein
MIHSCHLLHDFSLRLAGLKGKTTLDPHCGSGCFPGSAGRKNISCEGPIYTMFLTHPKDLDLLNKKFNVGYPDRIHK